MWLGLEVFRESAVVDIASYLVFAVPDDKAGHATTPFSG
jgi:hypothetical protein